MIILIRACQGANFNPLLPQPKTSRKTIGRTVNFYHLYPNTGQPEAVTHISENSLLQTTELLSIKPLRCISNLLFDTTGEIKSLFWAHMKLKRSHLQYKTWSRKTSLCCFCYTRFTNRLLWLRMHQLQDFPSHPCTGSLTKAEIVSVISHYKHIVKKRMVFCSCYTSESSPVPEVTEQISFRSEKKAV